MSGTRKMKGGVSLVPDYDRNEALGFFLNNSTFSVLTNNSISCITLVVTLNRNVTSPYTVLRSINLNARVDKILLKIFITAEDHGRIPIQGRVPYGYIEKTSKADFDKEISIQRDIYRQSFFSEASLLEPMCPHIFNWHHCAQNDVTVRAFKTLNGLTYTEQKDLTKILDGAASTNNSQISFIAMEFMDGFEVAHNILERAQEEEKLFFWDVIQYEFQRLNMYKYVHGDAHFGNVMIHPTYDYLNNGQTGRALIIDFGRTKKDQGINTNIVNNSLERFRNENMGIPPEHLIDINEFNALNKEKIKSMQPFYVKLGNYLLQHNHYNDLTYDTILPVLKQIIKGEPEHMVGGAPSKTKIKNSMKIGNKDYKKNPIAKDNKKIPIATDNKKNHIAKDNKDFNYKDFNYKDFKNNLIALFDDKANGELKGEIFELKRKKRQTRTNSTNSTKSTKSSKSSKSTKSTKSKKSTKWSINR